MQPMISASGLKEDGAARGHAAAIARHHMNGSKLKNVKIYLDTNINNRRNSSKADSGRGSISMRKKDHEMAQRVSDPSRLSVLGQSKGMLGKDNGHSGVMSRLEGASDASRKDGTKTHIGLANRGSDIDSMKNRCATQINIH